MEININKYAARHKLNENDHTNILKQLEKTNAHIDEVCIDIILCPLQYDSSAVVCVTKCHYEYYDHFENPIKSCQTSRSVHTHMEKCPDSGFWRRFVAIWRRTLTSRDASCTIAVGQDDKH